VVSLAGDFRDSTPRILQAVAYALQSQGTAVDYCGPIPTSAVTFHAMHQDRPSIMVTGSHIPDDRNGIKFNMPWGEVLKEDEEKISGHYHQLKERLIKESLPFSDSGYFVQGSEPPIPSVNQEAEKAYINRFLEFFPSGSLKRMRVIVYQHSSVSRDLLPFLLEALGAEVICVGRSNAFVPVDTEAVANPLEIADWISEYQADALASTDGDGDRPLLFDETGQQVRGDVLGILVAEFLGADSVSVPVSCNSAVEQTDFFQQVSRTRIGSPFVISSMLEAGRKGFETIVGYEANGGFLTASDIRSPDTGKILRALPTRDAALPIMAALRRSITKQRSLSEQVLELPAIFTSSGLIKKFPRDLGHSIVGALSDEGTPLASTFFGEAFGELESLDFTDGARLTFANGEIVHLRPSGNAPEFRCYTESNSQRSAEENNQRALGIVEKSVRPFFEAREG